MIFSVDRNFLWLVNLRFVENLLVLYKLAVVINMVVGIYPLSLERRGIRTKIHGCFREWFYQYTVTLKSLSKRVSFCECEIVK